MPRDEKIAKLLARAGVASRRGAERLILEGRVTLAGRPIESVALRLSSLAGVAVDGKPVAAPEPTRLWLFHKPKGVITTHDDPQGRTTLFELLPPDLPRVVSVGRLDYSTEGLILLTNDGGLAAQIASPKTGWKRRYRARVFGNVDEGALARLARGVTVDGIRYGAIEAGIERQLNRNAWLTLTLREGKNREVRRVLAHLGLKVSRLIRTGFGNLELGDLKPGESREVGTPELRAIERQLSHNRT